MEAMQTRHRYKMNRTTRYALILAAIAFPVSLVQAQYRIDNGQARDANNRIGSGGFNTTGQLGTRINGLAGNYIVTGNVTGGRAFRGSLGYTDTTSFRGSLGSATFDNYLRDSIGVSQMRGTSGANNNFATIQPYFGAGSTVAPPTGFARDPSTGAFYLPPTRTGVQPGDGRVDFGGASRADLAQGVLSAQRATGGAGLTTTPFSALNQRDQLSNLTRMSDFTAMARPKLDQLVAPDTGTLASGPRLPGVSEPQTNQASQDSLTAPDVSEVGRTGQGAVYRNLRALDNNTQYAELRKRMEERNALPKLPGAETAESLNRINADILAAREKEKAQQPDDTADPKKPALPTPPQMPQPDGANIPDPAAPGTIAPVKGDNLDLPRPTADEPIVRPGLPLEINSLAAGVKDQNLAKLLSDAEAAMKQGKFSTAIDAYSRAEELASDDPLVFMGRSIAELGGGYYRSAEIHLRDAFEADRALLLAKFDLRTMLTDARLNALQADLAAIARKNDKDAGPLLLLAFIYYNTGFPERSERALEMVQERVGGTDDGAKLLKEAWFPSKPVDEQSK